MPALHGSNCLKLCLKLDNVYRIPDREFESMKWLHVIMFRFHSVKMRLSLLFE